MKTLSKVQTGHIFYLGIGLRQTLSVSCYPFTGTRQLPFQAVIYERFYCNIIIFITELTCLYEIILHSVQNHLGFIKSMILSVDSDL